ncbi:MAG: type II toxin-antitoxin system RelE/ParE family toxin [Chakrabartia sp.]
MAEVELSPAARADLAAIDDYSEEQFGREVADAYAVGFEDAFDVLERHPHAGHAASKYGKGIRCMFHRKHRIFYTVRGDIVLIVRIVHHAQHAKRAMKWTP